jgi:hypothetical protein
VKPGVDDHIANTVTGLIVGAFIGATAGLVVCTWLLSGTLFLTGDTVPFGAVLCGDLGWWFGDRIFDWLQENWWWFW